MNPIVIRGARTHNLANIDLELPRHKLIVITGLSGSGKSSLAFDTIYAEGQRRYVESLSAYARQFLSLMEKPDVDHIEGLSPAISIEQKSTSHNPRSTVGTITEIHDYLRLLYARTGTPHCPRHGASLAAQTVSQMVDSVLALPAHSRWMLLAPVVQNRKGEYVELLAQLRAQGYVRARIDGRLVDLDDAPALDLRRKHTIEVVVDRFRVRDDLGLRLAESFEVALKLGNDIALLRPLEDDGRPPLLFSARFSCPECDYSLAELEPRMFSFNNPNGACPQCDGLGVTQFFDPARVVQNPALSLAGGAIRGWDRRNTYYFATIQALARQFGFSVDTPFRKLPERIKHLVLHGSGDQGVHLTGARQKAKPFPGILSILERRYRETDSNLVREELARYISNRPCPACGGQRLNEAARHVLLGGVSLPAISAWAIDTCLNHFAALKLEGWRAPIAERILKEVTARLRFLRNVGLDYLTLDRQADTLSGGEAQRIRLASQIGAGLVGVMYVLDEPSIGLHQRDNQRLLETLFRLRDLGNTVIVVEHDEEAILSADHVVDMGPGAGVHGGRVVYSGDVEGLRHSAESLTGRYLSGSESIPLPARRRRLDPARRLRLYGAAGNNLQAVDVDIPAGIFTCVTGVSGSGKSTLINDTIYRLLARELNGAAENPAPYRAVDGLENFDKVVDIDQSPIGRTPRSNPATYTGLFTPIRELFAGTQEARSRGYQPGRFSFNVKGGRCEACQGDGMLRVEMHFLPDIFVPCDVCHGQRYNRETLSVAYKGRNIDQVLAMTVEDALDFFAPVPAVARKLKTLMDVGLSYITLGQSATTLSGGEAQRIKLARELSKRDTGRTVYILDEPTTGLHFHDVKQLLGVLHRLCDHGNTVVVIEHNLEVIKTADWIIDLGPEGGAGGGRIIATGTPEEIAKIPDSHTGRFLATRLPTGTAAKRRKTG